MLQHITPSSLTFVSTSFSSQFFLYSSVHPYKLLKSINRNSLRNSNNYQPRVFPNTSSQPSRIQAQTRYDWWESWKRKAEGQGQGQEGQSQIYSQGQANSRENQEKNTEPYFSSPPASKSQSPSNSQLQHPSSGSSNTQAPNTLSPNASSGQATSEAATASSSRSWKAQNMRNATDNLQENSIDSVTDTLKAADNLARTTADALVQSVTPDQSDSGIVPGSQSSPPSSSSEINVKSSQENVRIAVNNLQNNVNKPAMDSSQAGDTFVQTVADIFVQSITSDLPDSKSKNESRSPSSPSSSSLSAPPNVSIAQADVKGPVKNLQNTINKAAISTFETGKTFVSSVTDNIIKPNSSSDQIDSITTLPPHPQSSTTQSDVEMAAKNLQITLNEVTSETFQAAETFLQNGADGFTQGMSSRRGKISRTKHPSDNLKAPTKMQPTSRSFACPKCKDPLNMSTLTCAKCQSVYKASRMYVDLILPSSQKTARKSIIPNLRDPLAKQNIFQSPLVSFVYERGWRNSFSSFGFPGINEEFKLLINQVEATVQGELSLSSTSSKYSEILDLSCGSGLMARRLASSQLFENVVAADFSESMLTETYNLKNVSKCPSFDIVRADVAALPFQNDAFRFIHSGAALHCWPRVQDGLKEVHRILEPNGTFFATTFLRPIPLNNFISDQMISNFPYRFFQEDELLWLFQVAGFKNVSVERRFRSAIIRATK